MKLKRYVIIVLKILAFPFALMTAVPRRRSWRTDTCRDYDIKYKIYLH